MANKIMQAFRRHSFLWLTNEEYDNLFANCLSLDTQSRITKTLTKENSDVTIKVNINGIDVPVGDVIDNLSQNFDDLVVRVAKQMAQDTLCNPLREVQDKLSNLIDVTDAVCADVNWESMYSDRLLNPQNICSTNCVNLLFNDGTRRKLLEHQVPLSDVVGVEVCEVGKPAVIVYPLSAGQHTMLGDDGDYKVFSQAESREVFAIEDFNGKDNTDALLRGGSLAAKAVQKMGQNLYIPSLGELNIICRHKDEINNILKHIEGADALQQSSTWSSTEYNSYYAWYVHFGNGNSGNLNKCTSYVVRPVVTF